MNKTVLNQAVIKMLTHYEEEGIKAASEHDRQKMLMACSIEEDNESITISLKRKNKKVAWKIKETLLGNAKLVGFFDEDHWHDGYLAVSITFAVYLQKRHGLDKTKLSALTWESLVAMTTLDVHGVAMKQPIQEWMDSGDDGLWIRLMQAKFQS